MISLTESEWNEVIRQLHGMNRSQMFLTISNNDWIKKSALEELNEYVDSIYSIKRYTKMPTTGFQDNRFKLQGLIAVAIAEIQDNEVK